MMRSRPFSGNSARPARKRNLVLAAILLLGGCSSSIEPTYLFENIEDAVRDVALKEYKLEVTSRLIEQTLWVYIPLEDIITKTDKPDKFTEKFSVEINETSLRDKSLDVNYRIKRIPDAEKLQEIKYKKEALDKITTVWRVMRRIIFSMDRSRNNPIKFIAIVTADVKNGFLIIEISCVDDFKKVSYEFISWGEFQHRTIQDTEAADEIKGNRDGAGLAFRNITMEEFLARQIQQRIKFKFQKPEVADNADIDKEVLKAVQTTLSIYKYEGFDSVKLHNLISGREVSLSRSSVLQPVD